MFKFGNRNKQNSNIISLSHQPVQKSTILSQLALQVPPKKTHSISRKTNTFEEKHGFLSETLIRIVRHAPLSEPTYKIYPSLQQDLGGTKHPSQNQNQTSTINKQIIHPRRNRNFTTPMVHFKISSSPSLNPLDLSSSTIQSTPSPLQSFSHQNTLNIPSDYLGSTPISEKVRENPFNSPTSTQRLPHWMTQSFTEGEPDLVNDSTDISTDTSLSLPENLSLLQHLQQKVRLQPHHFHLVSL